MNVLKQILPSGTVLADLSPSGNGTDRMYVKNKAALGQSGFPACLIDTGEYTGSIASHALFEGYAIISVRYYNRWEATNVTISQLELDAYVDLLRMAANVEDNNTLIYQGSEKVVSVPVYKIAQTPVPDDTIPGIKNAFFQEMFLFINVLPYDNA